MTFGDVGNGAVYGNVVIPFANSSEGFVWTEAAGGAAADVVLGKQGSLGTWIVF